MFILLLFISCEDDQTQVTEVKSGDIIGRLKLIYNVPGPDERGAKVAIKGTNISAVTDAQGRWTLKDVPQGVYDIVFTKDGFDTLEIYGVTYPGNGNMYFAPNKGFGGVYWATLMSSAISIYHYDKFLQESAFCIYEIQPAIESEHFQQNI